jgi:hypothetical protein
MPAFSLDAAMPPHVQTEVSLYDTADGVVVEDGALVWDLPEGGATAAASQPFFIKGLAADPTRPPALTAPAVELVYKPTEDGGADVTLQVVAKEKNAATTIVKVKFECKIGGQSSGTKACMGKRMTVTLPGARRQDNGNNGSMKLTFKVLQIL